MDRSVEKRSSPIDLRSEAPSPSARKLERGSALSTTNEGAGLCKVPAMPVRLHINIDHVATVRNARGERYPDPVFAAQLCEAAGADGITAHLREDRRHIRDDDIARLRASVGTLLNLEMAAT